MLYLDGEGTTNPWLADRRAYNITVLQEIVSIHQDFETGTRKSGSGNECLPVSGYMLLLRDLLRGMLSVVRVELIAYPKSDRTHCVNTAGRISRREHERKLRIISHSCLPFRLEDNFETQTTTLGCIRCNLLTRQRTQHSQEKRYL